MAAANTERKAMEVKVAAVREVVPQKFSKDQIILVLQHFDLDVSKTIHAFCEDGAQEALQTWSGGVASGKPKKGKAGPKPTPPTSSPVHPVLQHPPPSANGVGKVASNGHVAQPPAPIQRPKPETRAPPPNGILVETAIAGSKPQRSPKKSGGDPPPPAETSSNRERFISTSSSVSEAADRKKGLEKELKDLVRKEAGMSRASERFRGEMEAAGERLRRAFEEVRETLDAREASLKAELLNVKMEGNKLLAEKNDYARRLKAQAERAPNLSDRDMDLLRHDLRVFTHDRRQDEELATTIRFNYEPHPIASLIASFGSVPPIIPVKGTHPSASPPIHTTPIQPTIHNPPVQALPQSSVTAMNGITMKSSSLSEAELAEINRKLQESLLSQGISGNVIGMLGGGGSMGNQPIRRPPPRRPPPKAANGNLPGAKGKGGKAPAANQPKLSIL